MLIPVAGTRSQRLANLANTVAASSTFQRLVGANSAAAALASIHFNIALDDGTVPRPRCIIRTQPSQMAERTGYSWMGRGQMGIFVQYEFSKVQATADAALLAWYSLNAGSPTREDYYRHMDNLFGAMTDEMTLVSLSAGCLEFRQIEEHSCGPIDPVTENGLPIWELCWVLHREGLP